MSEGVNGDTMGPVIVNGTYFMKDSERFIVKGLVYQLSPQRNHYGGGQIRDPLRDERIDDLRNDIELFKELAINCLFVHVIEADEAHEQSLKALEQAGIYVVASLSGPRDAINRFQPRASYTSELRARFCAKIDALSKYSNVLGVSTANHIVNKSARDPEIPAVVRDAVKDMKLHMRKMNQEHGRRILPICVNDSPYSGRSSEYFDYYTWPEHPEDGIDFYMFANYDSATRDPFSWRQIPTRFSHSTKPILISEYGNNIDRPRLFEEVNFLYSADMQAVISGGFAYKYEDCANQYGLVKLDEQGRRLRLQDFFNLRTKLRKFV